MIHERAIKDHNREVRLFFFRLSFVALVTLVLLGVLIWRYYYLQVVHHQDYVTQSENNRIHVLPTPPSRGLIYDRNGILLADNRVSFTLSIVAERSGDLEQLLDTLDGMLKLEDNERERFASLLSRRKPYEPVPLRYNLTEAEQGLIAVNEYRLPGVEITAQLIRHYPFREYLGHVLGYVGRINDQEIRQLDPVLYSGTHVVGKSGIEKFYESELLGKVGYEYVETNARGRVMRLLERIDPEPGKNLHLFLDARLQEVAYKALGDERGAVTIYLHSPSFIHKNQIIQV